MDKIMHLPDARLAEPRSVLSFLRARSCKFVFRRLKGASMKTWQERLELRNAGSMLYLLEFNEDNPEPKWTQIPGVKAFAPLFSPDGTRVLYNTTFMQSEIFILSLADFSATQVGYGAHPHWWISPENGENYVIYRTENGLYTGFPRGRTMQQKIDSKNLAVGEPEEILPYGFGGGITPDGRYLATGYTHLITADLQTGDFLQGLGDRQLPDGENQVCDVSVAPDDSQRTMHLRLTEKGEGRHDFFGICNFDGSGYIKIMKPDGTIEWQTPEWSTHPDFGTAVATREDGTYDIYAIRISDRQIFRLTWDGGYGHVHLWIEPQNAD